MVRLEELKRSSQFHLLLEFTKDSWTHLVQSLPVLAAKLTLPAMTSRGDLSAALGSSRSEPHQTPGSSLLVSPPRTNAGVISATPAPRLDKYPAMLSGANLHCHEYTAAC